MMRTSHITVQDHVRWHCAAGHLQGVVKRINKSKNAAGEMIPWLIIGDIKHERREDPFPEHHTACVAGTRQSIKMLKMEVISGNTRIG